MEYLYSVGLSYKLLEREGSGIYRSIKQYYFHISRSNHLDAFMEKHNLCIRTYVFSYIHTTFVFDILENELANTNDRFKHNLIRHKLNILLYKTVNKDIMLKVISSILSLEDNSLLKNELIFALICSLCHTV